MDIGVLNALGEEGHLDVEVQVEECMRREEYDHDTTEPAVVAVDFFVGETCDELDRVVVEF